MHPLESTLLVVLGAWLVALPWAVGTMHVWAQALSAGLATLAIGVALLPRTYEVPGAGGTSVRYFPWRKLFAFPLFWCGLALLVYVALQALNPAWTYHRNAREWWLVPRPHLAWLPTSVDAPFEQMNAWRKVMIWSAPWLAVCAAWIGITRRIGAQALVATLAANGTLVAVLGILQSLSGTRKIYWQLDFPGAHTFASFVYKNHAAAFLLTALCAALGLALWIWQRGTRQGRGSTPAPLVALGGLVIFTGLVASASRLGAALGFALILLVPAIYLWRQRSSETGAGPRAMLVGGLVLVILLSFTGWLTSRVNAKPLLAGYASLARREGDVAIRMRVYAYEATRRMFASRPTYGVGAGGFRYLFPQFQKQFPDITQRLYTFGREGAGRTYRRFAYDHTHNDLLQLLAELGLVGVAPLLLGLASVLAACVDREKLRHPVALSALVGLLAMLAYGLLDFPWHNPAVAGSLAIFLTAAYRWRELESH